MSSSGRQAACRVEYTGNGTPPTPRIIKGQQAIVMEADGDEDCVELRGRKRCFCVYCQWEMMTILAPRPFRARESGSERGGRVGE